MARRDGWLEGVAVIRESDRIGHEAADQGEPWPWEIPMNIIGSRKYDFALDVTVAGALHRVEGPKLQAQMHANNKLAAMAWAEAVQLGNLTREQFDAQLTLEVADGRMDPADAAAARAKLGA
jgi:hypothetical protein